MRIGNKIVIMLFIVFAIMSQGLIAMSSSYLYGDVDGDGNIDSDDYGYMRQWLIGMIIDFPDKVNGMKAADVDGDGNVDSDDYGYMRQWLIGMILCFPAEKFQPAKPTGLFVTSNGDTVVMLKWEMSTSGNISGYEIYRDDIKINVTSNTNYSDIELNPNTTYSYYVKAINSRGITSESSDSVTINTPDTSAPTVPSEVKAVYVYSTKALLEWVPSTDNSFVKCYEIYRNNTLIANPSGAFYADSGLIAGTNYTYSVKAVDSIGNKSAVSNTLSIKTKNDIYEPNDKPEEAAQLSVTGSVFGFIEWENDLDYYKIQINIRSKCEFSLISPNGTNYDMHLIDSSGKTLANGDEYLNLDKISTMLLPGNYYILVNSIGQTYSSASYKLSSSCSIITDSSAPSAPSNLGLTEKLARSVSLVWDSSVDNLGVQEYQIFRGTTLIAATSNLYFEDTNLDPQTSYQYTIKACDEAGNVSLPSNTLTVTTMADVYEPNDYTEKAKIIGLNESLQGFIEWDLDEDYYKIKILNESDVTFSLKVPAGMDYNLYLMDLQQNVLATSETATTEEKIIKRLSPGTYFIFVSGVAGSFCANAYTISTSTSVINDTEAPSVPQNLHVDLVYPTSAVLSWTASTDNIGVANYEVYKDGVLVGTSPTASFTITGLLPLTSYNIKVRAKDAKGNSSAFSLEMKVTTIVDTLEPNDTISQAVGINISQVVNGAIETEEDSDYFKINIATSKAYEILLTVPQNKDYDLYVLDSAGNVIGSSATYDSVEKINMQLPTGVTYIMVTGYLGEYSPNKYSMTIKSI